MSEKIKNILLIGLIAITSLFVITASSKYIFGVKNIPLPNFVGGGRLNERTSYDTIGTITAPDTLSGSYDNVSGTIFATKLENLHFDLQYTPANTNSYASIKVEASNDDGTTYFPVATKSLTSQDTKIYLEDSSGTNVIPLIVPGDETSVSGTAYKASFDFDIIADHVRILAKENVTSTNGTIYIRSTLTSK